MHLICARDLTRILSPCETLITCILFLLCYNYGITIILWFVLDCLFCRDDTGIVPQGTYEENGVKFRFLVYQQQ